MTQKGATKGKMKLRQETTSLSQIATVTAKPRISDKERCLANLWFCKAINEKRRGNANEVKEGPRSVAWKICFYFHNKERDFVTNRQKHVKFVISAISLKTVKSAAPL